jgi:mono/diheme cytochrome c family protein
MRIGRLVSALVAVALVTAPSLAAEKAGPSEQVKRGRYLVEFGGCHDCHSPKMMTAQGPQPDPALLLSGYRAGTQLPPLAAGVVGPAPTQWATITNGDFTAWVGPWGTSYAANLTPDPVTGLGGWTADQFIKTMRTGKHLGVGRPVLPPMPWPNVAVLSDSDLKAVFAYLKSIKPIKNQVPPPVPPK